MSIGKGETIQSDWETWEGREGRIKAECEKNDEKFDPENDWNMAERQGEGYAGALENAEKRRTSQYPAPAFEHNPGKSRGSYWNKNAKTEWYQDNRKGKEPQEQKDRENYRARQEEKVRREAK